MADFDGMQRALGLLTGEVNLLAQWSAVLEQHDTQAGVGIQSLRGEVQGLMQRIAALPTGANSGSGSRAMRLIDEKHGPPEHFGKDSKDHLRFNSWSKKTLNCLDAKYPGFRVAMKWAADQGERVITAQEVAQSGRPDNTLGNPALYNYMF
jgi:hypothetical protein